MIAQVRPGYKLTEAGVIPEDWAASPLSKIADPKRPIGYGIVQTGRLIVNGVKCIRVVDIENGQVTEENLITTSETISSAYKRTILSEGDIVIALRGKIGAVAVIDSGLAGANLTRGVALLAPLKKHNSKYLCHYLSSPHGKQIFERNLNGSALQEIPISALRKIPAVLPPLPEQRVIAAVLSDMDALISGLDQLIAKKRDIKHAAMQLLLTGQQRLPGFTGEWENKQLGDVLRVRHGKNQSAVEVSDGKYPILATGGEIGRTNTFLYDKPSVLIGRKGTIDRPIYRNEPFWTVDTLFYTEIARDAVPVFIYYKFLMIDWRSYNEASGVPSLNASTIAAVDIVIPDISEQTAIATVLSEMDSELATLETRLNKARQLKQGMMQELLTGRIRLSQSSQEPKLC